MAKDEQKLLTPHKPNHGHAWKGSWNRPMLMDEDYMHPFNVARMTDHNVRGRDPEEPKLETENWENEGGATRDGVL